MESNKTKKTKQSKNVKRNKKRNAGLEKADALIQKHPEEKELFATYYGQKVIVTTYDGIIDFDSEGYFDIVGANKFTYNDYIDVQIKSFGKTRGWLATCYYNITLGFKGCVSKKTEKHICFDRIMVYGMYSDGVYFDGKEEHVWMDIAGFEECQIGDCVSFSAEVYRYVKTSNGKQIDFALRNPEGIKKIEAYELPSDNDLLKQAISVLTCETCYLSEHCNGDFCILSKNKKSKKTTDNLH